ncbi:MAG: ankyrin repeat domain-containing protein [Planctomycetes bacterium]|nr:ankyrin repeat domain-containing protein [Planctomycetota bacterium]
MRLLIAFSVGLSFAFVPPIASAQHELHQAIEADDMARVKKLLADKADVNRRREPPKDKVDPKKPFEFKTEGQWMIWYAQKKKAEHAELPLHGAIYLDRLELVPLLLAAGADPNLKLSTNGKTALHVAPRGADSTSSKR